MYLVKCIFNLWKKKNISVEKKFLENNKIFNRAIVLICYKGLKMIKIKIFIDHEGQG